MPFSLSNEGIQKKRSFGIGSMSISLLSSQSLKLLVICPKKSLMERPLVARDIRPSLKPLFAYDA
jgi:hypothetical protein